MSIEVMRQALEALEDLQGGCTDSDDGTVEALTIHCPEVIANLRAAIEQAEKPVAWVCEGISSDEKHSIDYQQEDIDALPVGTMLYTTPPTAPLQWVGLTDEERYGLYRKAGLESYHLPSSEVQYKYDRCIESYARAIEAKLKEKNRDQ
jgi:hypothetical protein